MLTLQEIQAITFEKAVFGGYDMKSVDDFVEQLTEDYAAMQKENAALKSKMKVLVDKIEEYRSVEDGMRKALLSAQNIATEMLEKAKNERDELISSARAEAESKIMEYRYQVEIEENKIKEAKANANQLINALSGYYKSAMMDLEKLASSKTLMQEKAAELQEAKAVKEVQEQHVSEPIVPADTKENQAIANDITGYIDAKQDDMQMKVFEVKFGADDQKPKFDFGDLKFGRDYQET